MSSPKLIGIALQLVVKDVVKTAEYYRDILGFRIIDYFLNPPVYAMVERDGCQVHFGKSNDDSVHINEDIRKGTTDFIIWVTDIDNFYTEVQAKGADIIEGIVKRVYGSREFVIRDCDGHRILVGD